MAITPRVVAAGLAAAVLLAPAALRAQELGPADSDDFFGLDSGRVAVGDLAPDSPSRRWAAGGSRSPTTGAGRT